MRISVTTENEIYPLEVAQDLELENFKALCEMEVGIPAGEMMVVFNAQPLTDDKKTLKDYGVKDGELIMVIRGTTLLRRAAEHMQQQRQPQGGQRQQNQGPVPMEISQFDFSRIELPRSRQTSTSSATYNDSQGGGQGQGQEQGQGQVAGQEGVEENLGDDGDLGLGAAGSGQDDPAVIRDMLLANPEQLALLRHNNPRLAEALTSGDLDKFASVLREQQEMRRDRERQRIRLLTADPFDMEAQRLIANEIQQENINANMEAAMEYNPESFGTVHMLYINCKVNGHDVKAFIDSGAQTTIMSQACAERCNIMRLVDTRWAGIAKGVGTQKIIGRVHMGQIQIENDFLASSFSILEEQPMDMLLGLDMLKRHQMCIDLKNNKLHIGTTGTATTFLSESELPDCARLTSLSEEEARRQSEKAAKESEDRALAEALAASSKEGNSGGASGSSASGATQHAEQQQSSSPPSDAAAPATAPAAAPAAVPEATAQQDNFSESDIQEIMQIGFTRVQAVEELRRQNGNKTQAIAALFAKSFKM
ncbi:protein DDI1 homolog 2 isoform X2 [Penaeus vannamei]|uniref:protein DDI1 homolog 2 isoform X2 n=1 Tax=Penaeus vannamei TaxID=6689 RepID=UPI000F66E703|nr:protein DDI1 homolog 2-like isoform X2 [Penaeus vannamei]